MLFLQVLAALFIALTCAALTVFGLRRRALPDPVGAAGHVAFLFDGPRLLDATRPARDLLRLKDLRSSDFDAVLGMLSGRFPGVRSAISQLAEIGEARISATDSAFGEVLLQYRNGATRIELKSDQAGSAAAFSASLSSRAITEEVEALRSMADDSPQLMWREDSAGTISWANAAFIEMSERMDASSADIWPPARVFEDIPMPDPEDGPLTTRQAIFPSDAEEPLWFDVTVKPANGSAVIVAQDVTAIVHADDLHRETLQTLTKTFAGLSVGLAVFNQERQLVLFNPALMELTKLRPLELIMKPRLDTFFDQLREKGILPEPRDYASWRRQMTQMEEAALRGDFIEHWPQPGGRALDVVGRPFPNGSVALFFNDVSENTSQNRELRRVEAIFQETLDGVGEAIAVFADDGTLLMSNGAYRNMWSGIGQEARVDTHIDRWREHGSGIQNWDLLTEKSLQQAGRELVFDTKIDSGQQVTVRARHLSDASFVVSFSAPNAPLSCPAKPDSIESISLAM